MSTNGARDKWIFTCKRTICNSKWIIDLNVRLKIKIIKLLKENIRVTLCDPE